MSPFSAIEPSLPGRYDRPLVTGSVFTEEGGRIVATELARGPWDANAQHGGAPAALLARAFEGLTEDDELVFARLTFELLRPVPLGELEVEASIVRPGKRVQLLEGSIFAPGGVEVVRARALRILATDETVPPTPAVPAPPGPEHGVPGDNRPPYRPMFAPDSVEIRFVSGQFQRRGPAAAWFRLHVPLVRGEEASPLQRLCAAADFPNGISAPLDWDEWIFINPELTIHLDRGPVGEWFCLDARTLITPAGVGTAEAVLFDERGRVGRATQSLLVARRPAAPAGPPT
jgi:hypothetical protein